MPSGLTETTEIATALGMLRDDLDVAMAGRPAQLASVSDAVWSRLVDDYRGGSATATFATAFANGRAFLAAQDGLRSRPPLRVEWRGPLRVPGDDVVPADLRVDHVFLVSCKYLSQVLVNAGPSRLFDRLLTGDERSNANWFSVTAPQEFQALYAAARPLVAATRLPASVGALTREDQRALKDALRARAWPSAIRPLWEELSAVVSRESALRWETALRSPRDRQRLLWRLLRITTATYFVLGADRREHLRMRIDSAWDWAQAFELRAFEVAPRTAGQPEVAWRATVRHRIDRSEKVVDGHVEIRWSHGRFLGLPEAKVYLDSPHASVPGYHQLS